ncbi:hypothetical protein DFH06DRAFT_189733 [Mycena polygramma]|nr:hypothetical protein DFH06DRAFT_189733 [Mycena polygramma]
MSSIPHELIAAIVDELEHDRASLKACSLVASAFCSPSQRHLFRAMWLHRENWQFYTSVQEALHRGTTVPSGTIKRGSALLSESPHLAAYVRDLTIDLSDSANEDVPLAHVLQAAQNLERFVISGLVVHWGDLSGPLVSTLLDAFARPGLKSVHLLNMRDVPASAMLRVLASARVVSIHYSTFTEEEELAENASPDVVSVLNHLILSTGMPSTYDLILSPRAPQLRNVTKLLLRVDTAARLHAERLLSSLAGTLVQLELDFGELSFPFTLTHLPHLRVLTLRIFRGIARRLPDGFAGTLAGLSLPTLTLTTIFVIQNRLYEGPWADDGPLTIPTPEDTDAPQPAMKCELLFLDPSHTKPSARNAEFAAFCAAMRAALPGFELRFARVDEENSYIGQLP